MAPSHTPKDAGPRRRWMPAALAGLLGWNLAVTGMYFGAAAVKAEPPTCASVQREAARLKGELKARDAAIKHLTQRLRQMARGNIRIVERALVGTGITVDRLIERGRGANQGGPFIPADTEFGPAASDIARWESLNRVMRVLPLGSPILGAHHVSSGFGTRRDPINKRRAVHEGIDLRAPLRTPIHATGPGVVVFAGSKGRYGRTVEIDHGLGVVTRYAHLAAIQVRKGQRVAEGRRIGLLGNSGRTTGPHLHYEVIVDGKANNPRRFIRAGITLAGRR